MVRAPCCEKMGLKKGPWTPEEDQILVAYIQKHGHGNWRALPKQADAGRVAGSDGQITCDRTSKEETSAGKKKKQSTNYMNCLEIVESGQDTWVRYRAEEVINLIMQAWTPSCMLTHYKAFKHGQESHLQGKLMWFLLGRHRWSAIAARLPGRTDNEIKNVWHTHLKKRLDWRQVIPEAGRHEPKTTVSKCNIAYLGGDHLKLVNFPTDQRYESHGNVPTSPQQSSSNISTSATDSSVVTGENVRTAAVKAEYIGATDENLWSEALSGENTAMSEYSGEKAVDPRTKFQFLPASLETGLQNEDGMDFWLNHFLNIEGEFIELPKF
ncbi:hypothetical protein ACLOJK_011491 [Asimina triloba]